MKGGREGNGGGTAFGRECGREEVPGAIVYARMKERECEICWRKREVVRRCRRRSICISSGWWN